MPLAGSGRVKSASNCCDSALIRREPSRLLVVGSKFAGRPMPSSRTDTKNRVLFYSYEPHPDRSARTVRISILAGIRDELIYDECHQNCAIRRKLYLLGRFEVDLTRRDHRLQVFDDFPQIRDQVDTLISAL